MSTFRMATASGMAEVEASGRGTSSVSERDYPEQLDEVTALESIYGQETFRVVAKPENGVGSFEVEFSIPINVAEDGVLVELWLPVEAEENEPAQGLQSNLPSQQWPSIARSESGQRQHVSSRVYNLPPLTLSATLPPNYPSQDRPVFDLSCGWLSATQLSKLSEQLEQMWTSEMPVLFTWADWLQNETLSYLELEKTITLALNASAGAMDLQPFSDHDDEAAPEEIFIKILRYDHDREIDKFKHQQHECGICLEIKFGTEFVVLPDCGHAVCQRCLQEFCQVNVSEGTVLKLSCPMDECKAPLPHHIIRSVLRAEEYGRWQEMLTQRELDSMGDVLWCPRCNQPVVKEPEEKLSLAWCWFCRFCFCTQCLDPWHAGKKCQTLEDMLENVQRELGADFEEVHKEIIETVKSGGSGRSDSPIGMNNIRHKLMGAFKSKLSISLIRRISRPCPTCGMSIQKAGGCNDMICAYCQTQFCWACGGTHGRTGYGCHEGGVFIYTRAYKQKQMHQTQISKLQEEGKMTSEVVITCPRCKQNNVKRDRNNHMRCWQCNAEFCFLCKTLLNPKGQLTDHFNKFMCAQHSD